MKNNQIKIIFQHIDIYESCETDKKETVIPVNYTESDGFISLWIFEFRDLELYRLKFTDPWPSLFPILDGTGYSSYCAWRRVGRKARVGIFTIWRFLPTRCDDFSFSSQLNLIPSYMHVTIDVQTTIAISEKCSVRYSKITRYRLVN